MEKDRTTREKKRMDEVLTIREDEIKNLRSKINDMAKRINSQETE